MKSKYNVVEFFSGIGSQIRALQNIGLGCEVQATCEWDIHAIIAYDVIHNGVKISNNISQLDKSKIIKELNNYTFSNDGKSPIKRSSLEHSDIRLLRSLLAAVLRTKNLVDISKVKGMQMPKDIDILTYSFPCQDLSNVGAFHGYNKGIDKDSGSRSSLLWQVGRILFEMLYNNMKLPRYLIMENVPSLLSNRHRKNFEMWKKELEDLGYVSKEFLLNAKWFGVPQNRPRLLMLSIYVGKNQEIEKKCREYFDNLTSNDIVEEYQTSKYYHLENIKNLLRIPESKDSLLWKEAVECTPNDTPSRRRIWNENPKILDSKGKFIKEDVIRTLTTKQDRNPNSGNLYFDTGIEGKGKFRYLTPRECLLFMGFTDDDYVRLIDKNGKEKRKLFTRDKIIRMAGNSIPVKLLEGFFYQLKKVEKLLN